MSTAVNIKTDDQEINFTVRAADKVFSLLEEESDSSLNLRVYITGGGCSGFQYGFAFDGNTNHDDIIIKQQCSNGDNEVNLLVDSMSYQFLQGAEIDYVQGIQGEQFVIRNPNAKTTCGCGSSFSIDEDEEF